jgi:rhodanese-related sulfurtransferase
MRHPRSSAPSPKADAPRAILGAALLASLAACTTESGAQRDLGASGGSESWMPPGTEARWQSTLASIERTFPDVPSIRVPELVAERAGANAPLVVDVRPSDEWAVGHLPGARHAPTERLPNALSDVAKDSPIVVYCSVGWRSAEAARSLREAGFENVRNLIGSAFEWANRGLPLESDDGPTERVHPYNADWGELVAPPHRAPLDETR